MATRIQLEGIVLSEESKAEKDECSVISMICQVSKTWTQSTMVVVRGWGALCLLIAHHKPGSGSDKENPALGKEPGVLASVWNALGICMLLCVLAANSSVQFVSTCCVLAICFPHHVNQNCRVSRSTQARLQTL